MKSERNLGDGDITGQDELGARPTIDKKTYGEMEMLEDYQDWEVETEDEPGKKRKLSKELIDFYVSSFVKDYSKNQYLNRVRQSDSNDELSYRLNWQMFVEYTHGLSDGTAPFEFVDLHTVTGQRLKLQVERQYEEHFLQDSIKTLKKLEMQREEASTKKTINSFAELMND